jgi:FlaA1/EpsC-like NDP-sugar epimerase
MENNPFFIPSPLYKEFMLLDVIEKNPSITQRAMSQALNVAVSMINSYLGEYEEKGYLKRIYQSSKVVEYKITPVGKARRKLLNIWYLNASQQIYASAKLNISLFLENVKEKGFKRLYLYGAGEVAEIFIQVLRYEALDLQVLGIIDDDDSKHGKKLYGLDVLSFSAIESELDGFLISSYKYQIEIFNRLKERGIPEEKIIGFF